MNQPSEKKILGASLSHCVHVAGILNFLNLAEDHGYQTQFLGPAVSITKLKQAIESYDPDFIALSYRLTPEALVKSLAILKEEIQKNQWEDKVFLFGGTPPAAEVARRAGLFDVIFSGRESNEDTIAFLEGKIEDSSAGRIPPQNLLERISFRAPHPLLRHHFGLPSLQETIRGVQEIALSEVVDVISLGPDQNAQESFFRPHEMKEEQDGAGGVPLRKPKDLEAIYKSSRCGNFPLLRCYSGTRDLLQWAEMLLQTIDLAWGAVPLCWYNQLDGRSDRTPLQSISENQKAMKWYAEHHVPLEVNESHHWSLREAPDSVAVATAFLAAYNAKKTGTKHYVAQYMFNTPAGTSPFMDLAKMLAKIELIESLHDKNFSSIRQTRTGLARLCTDPAIAKGELAASSLFQMAIEPKIIHVVGFCEADHAAIPSDVIESSKIVQGVISHFASDSASMIDGSKIKERKRELVKEARLLLHAIENLSSGNVEDPLSDPATITKAIKIGLLDAPHLCGNRHAAGRIYTQIRQGACVAVDLQTGKILTEKERISRIMN